MTRSNEQSSVSMVGCINVCGCDVIESKFEEKDQRQKVKESLDSGNTHMPNHRDVI